MHDFTQEISTISVLFLQHLSVVKDGCSSSENCFALWKWNKTFLCTC